MMKNTSERIIQKELFRIKNLAFKSNFVSETNYAEQEIAAIDILKKNPRNIGWKPLKAPLVEGLLAL